MIRRLALPFLCLLFFTGNVLSGELQKLELERTEKGFYLIDAEIKVQAKEEKVISLLTDYDHLTRLNSQVLESELVSVNEKGVSQVRTKIRPCGYLFCKIINQVQNIKKLENGSISAAILPEQSDFIEGEAKWRFQPKDEAVVIHLQARLLPRFWVPPLINLWLMRRMIENEMVETILNLEKLQPR